MPIPFKKKELAIQKKANRDWNKLAKEAKIPQDIIDKVKAKQKKKC